MANPKITEQINGYLVEWPDHHLEAKVSRVRTPSDGQVKGELEIRYRNGKEESILLVPTQFNFSSEPTRAKYANQLAQKIALPIEWRAIFDYLSQKVQEMARLGDGYIEVFPDEDTPPPEQLLRGIIYKGVQNIIFGEKGANKSTLAYLLGMCATLPWRDNPLDIDVPAGSVKALVLDWETDHAIFRYCVSRLQKGMKIPVCSLYYRRCTLPLMDDIEAIQRQVEETGAELLIIDSLGAAAGGERGELKGAESALLFNAALRKLKRTSLIIAQTRKGDDAGKKTIYGSTYFTYYARNIFELCQGADDLGDTQHLALFHRECNLGKKIPTMGIRIEYNDATGAISMERESVSIAEFSQKVSVSMRILEILKGGAMTSKELREELDVSRGSVDMAIKRLRGQRKITDIGDKRWGLPIV